MVVRCKQERPLYPLLSSPTFKKNRNSPSPRNPHHEIYTTFLIEKARALKNSFQKRGADCEQWNLPMLLLVRHLTEPRGSRESLLNYGIEVDWLSASERAWAPMRHAYFPHEAMPQRRPALNPTVETVEPYRNYPESTAPIELFSISLRTRNGLSLALMSLLRRHQNT